MSWNTISQFWPPKPDFTETDIPDGSLAGKVYIVTGSNTGIGKELAQLLYSKAAKIYIAARSKDKALKAIEDIQAKHPESKGQLVFLPLDLADLSTIKASATEFLSKEQKLHILFNNAGIMDPPAGSKSAQGYELQLGVNCLGTFLFTKLLTPILVSTATSEPSGSVRVVWVSSAGAELGSPIGGVEMDNLDYNREKSNPEKYAISKAGNYLHSTEFAKRFKKDGVVSIALNPGALKSDLYRNQSCVQQAFTGLITYEVIYGAYTELFAGLSDKISLENSGEWVGPWGRLLPIRADMLEASKSVAEGGTGNGEKWWEWSEEQVKPFL
ncbi:hypothetical protein HYFRA_00006659 [Hymenoscyphus fraxineus]|uniref:Short-chain dehydrogenase n=1 Tax=Hymenoscyphus fraxineus TaxID=746836 RepID=A0A9N9PST7_9HELO|nr:hypothetical protein HYFRA_00006659 [Hymenoscyphus fraxineus]